jgi:hypothetical protein
MKFREFRNEDAEFCFKTRSAAFIEKFYNEIECIYAARLYRVFKKYENIYT